jgi:hypothetical protein
MNKNKLIFLVLLIFAAGAVISWITLVNKDETPEQKQEETKKADVYSSNAKITALETGKITLEIPYGVPGEPVYFKSTVFVVDPNTFQAVRRVVTNNVVSYRNIAFKDLKVGMEVIVYGTTNPKEGAQFNGTKIEVIK